MDLSYKTEVHRMEKEKLNQDWMERIANYRSSGLTMKGWCNQYGFSIDQLKYWLYKHKPRSSVQAGPSPDWLPVVVSDPSSKPGNLLVHVGSTRIEVHAGFEPQLLRDVVKALNAGC